MHKMQERNQVFHRALCKKVTTPISPKCQPLEKFPLHYITSSIITPQDVWKLYLHYGKSLHNPKKRNPSRKLGASITKHITAADSRLTEAKRGRKQHYKSHPPFFCTKTNHAQLERDHRPLMAKWLLFFSPSMMDKITWCHRCHGSHGNLLQSQSGISSKEMCFCRNTDTVAH